jgi:hypothetical protein
MRFAIENISHDLNPALLGNPHGVILAIDFAKEPLADLRDGAQHLFAHDLYSASIFCTRTGSEVLSQCGCKSMSIHGTTLDLETLPKK